MKLNQPVLAARQARILPAIAFALVGTLVWTHASAGVLRAQFGVSIDELSPASLWLTWGAVAAALAACSDLGSMRRAALRALGVAFVAWAFLWYAFPALPLVLLALPMASCAWATLTVLFARYLPSSLGELSMRYPKLSIAWMLVVLLAVVQTGRLATYMTDASSDWYLTTRSPLFAKHECANAYVYAAELARRGEPNLYDAAHYPGLAPDAQPITSIAGLHPEDPYQYPPQFLLLPRLAIAWSNDYGAIRMLWFGLNLTLCLGACLALAKWVGGKAGTMAGLLTPMVMVSVPVLHNFQYGQFHFATIALAILGLLAFHSRRSLLGGTLLASAILAKLFPAVILVALLGRKRWRDLGSTLAAAAVISLVSLLVLGSAPFSAFWSYHLPRLLEGSAFAFDEAWPDYAAMFLAGNQGIIGIVEKLEAMGWVEAAPQVVSTVGRVFGVALLVLSYLIGRLSMGSVRSTEATIWLGLLGLGSLSSAGAWTDYVPLTCVWMLAHFISALQKRPVLRGGLVLCSVLQITQFGTMPFGSWGPAEWLIPLSLLSALAMLASFTGAAFSYRLENDVQTWPAGSPGGSSEAIPAEPSIERIG